MSSKKKVIQPWSFNLPPVGVETHAHLDFPDYAGDLDQVLARARQAGIAWVGNIFLSACAYRDCKPALTRFPGLFFTLGVHPHEAADLNEQGLAEIAGLFRKNADLRAVGEIGLDFYRNHSPRAAQVRAFQDQLALARELDLPVVIHSRDAEQDTLRILMDLGFHGRPLLWHCFGKGPDLAEEVLSHGWLISVPGSVTFPKNTDLRYTVARLPLSHMVLETDCPFLTPHPFRGRRNEPAYLVYIAEEIARLREETIERVWTECAATARRFFNLPSGTVQPAP